MKDSAVMRTIENDRKVTEEQDGEFLFLLQSAILLELKEAGILNEIQCRYAEEKLRSQFRNSRAGETYPLKVFHLSPSVSSPMEGNES